MVAVALALLLPYLPLPFELINRFKWGWRDTARITNAISCKGSSTDRVRRHAEKIQVRART